jgi:hypothetical protein
MAPLPLLIALLVGCGQDPMHDDAAAYHAAMQPLVARNLLLARGFLDIASQVRKGETDGARIAVRLDAELTPLADFLQTEASTLKPATAQLGDAHAVLVHAWSERAAAYHALSAAWTAGDPAALEAARQRNLQAKVEEERYFRTVNELFSAYGLELDQYPELIAPTK